MATQGDEKRRFPRSEVDGRQAVARVERVSASAAALRRDGHRRVAERVEVAGDRANRDAKAIRELVGRDARATAAQVFGESEESFGASHGAGGRRAYDDTLTPRRATTTDSRRAAARFR